jgi:hypothetical protein
MSASILRALPSAHFKTEDGSVRTDVNYVNGVYSLTITDDGQNTTIVGTVTHLMMDFPTGLGQIQVAVPPHKETFQFEPNHGPNSDLGDIMVTSVNDPSQSPMYGSFGKSGGKDEDKDGDDTKMLLGGALLLVIGAILVKPKALKM